MCANLSLLPLYAAMRKAGLIRKYRLGFVLHNFPATVSGYRNKLPVFIRSLCRLRGTVAVLVSFSQKGCSKREKMRDTSVFSPAFRSSFTRVVLDPPYPNLAAFKRAFYRKISRPEVHKRCPKTSLSW